MSSFRQLMMKKKGGGETYTLLNYIQFYPYNTDNPFTGFGAYIDTGLVPDNNTEIKTKIKNAFYVFSQNTPVFGCYGANAGNYMHLTPYGGYWYYTVSGGNEQHSGSYTSSDGYEYIIDFNNNGSIIVSGTTIASGKSFEGNGNLCIGRRGSVSAPYESLFGYFKYYYFQVYQSGVLVRDFVPARRDSDQVLGFLDKVHNVFYTNAGESYFIGG